MTPSLCLNLHAYTLCFFSTYCKCVHTVSHIKMHRLCIQNSRETLNGLQWSPFWLRSEREGTTSIAIKAEYTDISCTYALYLYLDSQMLAHSCKLGEEDAAKCCDCHFQ